MKMILKAAIYTVIVVLPGIQPAQAQTERGKSLKESIEARHYTFKAQTVSPLSGRLRQLTPGYTLKVIGDSVISDLPYFGRAYSAPANMTGGGIQFTSVKFGYKMSIHKGKRREITIRPKDTDVQEMVLTVFDNGKADLKVTSADRQFISFNGYVSGN